MPNYAPSTRQAVVDIGHGLRCDASPASILTGQNHLFAVKVGRVWMTDLMGVVTTLLGGGALKVHFDFDADVGGDAAMCIDHAGDMDASAAGVQFVLPAAAGSALAQPAGAFLKLFPSVGWVLSPGWIDYHASAARTGVIKWSVWYYPLDEGAYVEAV